MKTSTNPRVNAGQAAAALVLAIAMTACGGSDNGGGTGGGGSGATGGSGTGGTGAGGGGTGGAFAAATPPSDVCSLLTLADAQSLLPGVTAGVEQQSPGTADFWSRDCKWDAGSTSIELVVFGALTKDGAFGIKAAASSGDVNTPVSGLGDEAHYWQDTTYNTTGLWALKGSYSVDVTAYFIVPAPPETQFHPLVEKALGEI